MYLLDTDTLIFTLKGNPEVRKNLQQHVDDPIRICVITLMELYYGAHKSERRTANLAKVRAIESNFDIIGVTKEIAEVYGMLKASLEKTGIPLDDFDLTIASCAMTHNQILVTNNTKHFERIEGLRLTNWMIFPEKDEIRSGSNAS